MMKGNLKMIMVGDFEKREGYKCESEPIDTDSPADNLNDTPPQAIVSKTKPNVIKEPIFAYENRVFYIINFKIYYDYENY